MGAIHFSIDVKLLEAIFRKTRFDAFVETGTFKGETVEKVRHLFPEIHSIELSEEYYKVVSTRFEGAEGIHLYFGDSASKMTEILEKMGDTVICFWLDAHWCVEENTGGGGLPVPASGRTTGHRDHQRPEHHSD